MATEGFRYRSVHLADMYIAENEHGIIDTVYRRMNCTTRQAVMMFPDGNFSKELTDKESAELVLDAALSENTYGGLWEDLKRPKPSIHVLSRLRACPPTCRPPARRRRKCSRPRYRSQSAWTHPSERPRTRGPRV